MHRRSCCWLACVGAALLSGSAFGDVPGSYGLGSRAAAMAGAVSADADDFSSVYYNPAGLVSAKGVSVSVGYMANLHKLAINQQDSRVRDVRGVVFGLVAPGRLFDVPVAFGLAAHLPDNGISYLKAERQGTPRWEIYGSRQQLLYLAADLAVRLTSWLDVGAGIGFLSATRGSFFIRGRANVLRPFDSQLEHQVDADLTSVRYPQVGARFHYPGLGSLALTYRGQSNLDLQLDARLQGLVDFAGIEVPLLYELEAQTISAFTPQQVTLGLSFQAIPTLHINADLTWYGWSGYKSPTATIAADLQVEPPPGTPIALPDSPPPTVPVSPRFRDRLAPRLGVEWIVGLGTQRRLFHGRNRHLFEWATRLGYSFDPTPVPDQLGSSNFVDSNRHNLAAGVGLSLVKPSATLPAEIGFDVHGSYSLLEDRRSQKDNPSDFVGDFRASGSIVGFGAGLELSF